MFNLHRFRISLRTQSANCDCFSAFNLLRWNWIDCSDVRMKWDAGFYAWIYSTSHLCLLTDDRGPTPLAENPEASNWAPFIQQILWYGLCPGRRRVATDRQAEAGRYNAAQQPHFKSLTTSTAEMIHWFPPLVSSTGFLQQPKITLMSMEVFCLNMWSCYRLTNCPGCTRRPRMLIIGIGSSAINKQTKKIATLWPYLSEGKLID